MPSGVIVAGTMTNDGTGGLKESLGATRKHFREVGDALLNISGTGTVDGLPVDKDEPRPTYDPRANQWPMAAYHADGRFETAETPDQLQEFIQKGFRREPYPKAQVALNDPATEKKELQRKLTEKDGQIASLQDLFEKALQRLDALEAKKK